MVLFTINSSLSVRHTLKKYWGYDDFRPLQEDIITSVLDGCDTLGLLPTGGGKSITFQVPAMMLPGLTIVVTPLISLMKDQVDNLLRRGIRACALHSGLSVAETRLAYDRCALGKAKILYVSPERLQARTFIDRVRTFDVRLIVVDEAHCISQWGYDFRPSYLNISSLRTIFPDAPLLALTASATPEVADDIICRLGFRKGYRRFAKSFDRDNLSYIVRYDDYKERTLLKALSSTTGTAIVYVRSRRRCAELAAVLEASGISASYYHAGLDVNEKEERQNAWKNDEVRVMVATNAFGMGIDKPDVRMVVHYDLPSSLEEYYQEAGRAGRDGLPSYALTIVAKSDKATLTRRLNDSFPEKDFIRRVYELAGNFLEVAVGSGFDQVYDFDFNKFCTVYSLPPTLTYSALKILTQAGYIEFVDEVQTRSRVMITARKDELYGLELDDVTDEVFSALQREYTGLFADYVYISEGMIARRAGVSEQQVYESMLRLSRAHALSYVPKKSTPYIYYTTSREEPRYVLLPDDVYARRRDRMKARIDAVKQFAFDSTQCRSVTILRYFGEKEADDCGRCDVCRSRKAAPRPAADLQQRVEAMMHLSPQQIMESLPEHERRAAIEIIRGLKD